MRSSEDFSSRSRLYFHVVAFILLGAGISVHLDSLDLLPMFDEVYHISDALAEGKLSSINPFDPLYDFWGHPPFYRMTLFLWFKVFPPTYISAHLHALLFSFAAIYMFYLIFFYNFNWALGFVAAATLTFLHDVMNDLYKCLADIPALFFFLFTLFQLQKNNSRLSALGIFCLVMTRESGVALPISMFLLSLLSFKKSEIKKTLCIILPGTLSLLIFFLISSVLHGKFSNHPFATLDFIHFSEKIVFFSWSDSKNITFFKLIDFIRTKNFFTYLFPTLIIPLTAYIFYFKKIPKQLRYISHLFVMYSIAFIAFFTLYEDVIRRDITPVYVCILFILFLGVVLIFKKFSIIPSIVIAALMISPEKRIELREFARNDSRFLLEVAKSIEQKYAGKTVCFYFPLKFPTQKIHGYFDQSNLKFSCESPSVVVTLSYAGRIANKRHAIFAKKNGMKLVHKNWGDEFHQWYKVYAKE